MNVKTGYHIGQPRVLETAQNLVYGDREEAYGHPRRHFGCTAKMVTAYLHRRGLLIEGAELEPQDWAMFMVLDKVTRYSEGRGRDSLVDVAGYVGAAERLEEE